MTAILDYCVPSRRRGRQERKEQQALASLVNSRWGDIQITAPSEGGWNQPASMGEDVKDLPVIPFMVGSPHNSGSSVSTTPDLSALYDKAVEAGMTIDQRPEVVQLPPSKDDRKNISFTITLPWPSRRANVAPTAGTPPMTSPPARSEPAGTNSRPSTANSRAPTSQIPASDKYMKDLAASGRSTAHINPLAQSPPDRAVETFPLRSYAAKSENYVNDLTNLGFSPSPPLYDGPSLVQHTVNDPVLRHGPSPLLQHTSPIMRLEPIPATPYCVDNFSDDLRTEGPEAVIPSHPALTERHPRARSSSREPHSDRYARMRSASRGPAEDRSGRTRPSSRAAVEDRSSNMRSSSRGPAEDRVRPSARAPTPDQMGAPRSSSRDAGPDRLGAVRSTSRGPPVERSGRQRSSSMGPPAGRIAMVRSASREPMADRSAYRRAPHRDSSSSDSSAATMFSDDLENNKPVRHLRAPSQTIANPIGLGQIRVGQSGPAQTGGPGGYYSSLASEYRQIAKDVETQALSETDSSEGKEYKNKKKIKDRLKETYQEGQTLVPHPTDLYG